MAKKTRKKKGKKKWYFLLLVCVGVVGHVKGDYIAAKAMELATIPIVTAVAQTEEKETRAEFRPPVFIAASGSCADDRTGEIGIKVGGFGFETPGSPDNKCPERENGRLMMLDMPVQFAINRCRAEVWTGAYLTIQECYTLDPSIDTSPKIMDMIREIDARDLEVLERCGGKRGWLKTDFRKNKRIQDCEGKVRREQRMRPR